jgi:hypothetical protein
MAIGRVRVSGSPPVACTALSAAALLKSRNPNGAGRFLIGVPESQRTIRNPAEVHEPVAQAS